MQARLHRSATQAQRLCRCGSREALDVTEDEDRALLGWERGDGSDDPVDFEAVEGDLLGRVNRSRVGGNGPVEEGEPGPPDALA